jgi:hypothetical protein
VNTIRIGMPKKYSKEHESIHIIAIMANRSIKYVPNCCSLKHQYSQINPQEIFLDLSITL